MSFELPSLPYPIEALEPYLSRRTMEFHYGKHHAAYVSKLNDLIEETPYTKMSLDDILRESADQRGLRAIFNNAAQAWNHTFFWHSMRPGGGGIPRGAVASRLEEAFGGYDEFRRLFIQAAIGQFGSGWVWLVLDNGQLAVMNTPNAGNPLIEGKIPLLTCDVWEHAYYLDYQNQRQQFVEVFLDRLLNWEHVSDRFKQAPPR